MQKKASSLKYDQHKEYEFAQCRFKIFRSWENSICGQNKSSQICSKMNNIQISKSKAMKKETFLHSIVIFLIIISTIESQTTKQKDLPTFQSFKERFKKQYATKQQQQYRRSVYNQNRKEILQNTECVDCGINVYSDLTLQERKSQLFGLQVPQNFEQIVAENQQKVKSKLKGTSVSFPTSLDWREKKAVTKVRNQGGCGACWAFEMVGAAESLLLIEGKGNPNTLDLSEQGLLQCTSGSTCNGGYPSKAAELIISGGGLYNQTKYPYRPNKFYKGEICSAKKDFPSPAVSSSNYYGISDQQIIELLQVSPIGVTIDADSLSSRYDPTKNPVHKCSVGDNQINHGILLVGYTPTYWIIKNSWGTKWGIDGYAYISRNRVNNENCVIQTWITVLEANCTVPNCKQCSPQTSCAICNDGFYLVKNGSVNTCKQCIDPNCLSCYTKTQNAALQGRCKICKKGFSLEASSQKCTSTIKLNITNCLVHSSDYNSCITCDDGFVLSSNSKECLKCEVQNCEECLTGYQDRCKSCKPGYVGDKCEIMCSDKCEGGCSTPGVCTKCQDGYTGKNCQIVVCIDNCLKCSTPYTCDECQAGYTLPNCQPEQNPKILCASGVMNCAKGCSKDPYICDQCDKDFFGPQCNIQYTCDEQNCRSIITIPKAALKSNQGGSDDSYINQLKSSSQDPYGSIASDEAQKKQTSLTIGLIVACILFVFTMGFAVFLIYRLRTIKRINIIQPLDSEGSSKSIPYVGKNLQV